MLICKKICWTDVTVLVSLATCAGGCSNLETLDGESSRAPLDACVQVTNLADLVGGSGQVRG